VPIHNTDANYVVGLIHGESFNRPRAIYFYDNNLYLESLRFERSGGAIFGAMLMIAIFSLAISVLNRDLVFFLFGAWILTSLRVAAQNGGWDLSWLGINLPPEILRGFLRTTLILHFIVSIGLFARIFQRELDALKLRRAITYLVWPVVLVTLFAWALSASIAIFIIWLCGLITIAFISWALIFILRSFPSTVAFFYAGGWGIASAGLIGEIFSASLGTSPLSTLLNSQTSALASVLVMATALGARIRDERLSRIEAQGRAVSALQRFHENYNAMPVGLFSTRPDGAIIEYNPAFGVMFGLPPPSLYARDRNWYALAGDADQASFFHQGEEGRITDTVFSIGSAPSEVRWLHMRALRKNERIDAWIEDITIRKNAESSLRFLADHDPLTSLLNRRAITGLLEGALRESSSRAFCLAYIDLDRFKLVNDLFGHVAGDQILSDVATRMRQVVTAPHVSARIGGDEFVVLIDGLDIFRAKELCETLLQALSDSTYQHQDKVFSIAASIGVVQLDPAMSVRDALTASDRACAESKSAGGSTVVAYDPQSSALAECLDEIKLIANIRERLPVENFFTQMQPIVSLRNPYSPLSYEVLVRMRDTDGSVIVPSRFIGAAERNGLMGQIDRWVLRSTLEWLDAHPGHRDSMGFCTINLSGASLNDERFLQDTLALVGEHRASAGKICFEITETVALYDLNNTRRFVDKVKSFGARIALDDFGKGYTSFNYLKELPGDLVKIDGGFIKDINSNSANYAITRAVVDLSHEIGMACVAEWAENADIIRTLVELEVDYAQGFGLSRPVAPAQLLGVKDAVTLIRDPEVIEILGPPRLLARIRDRVPDRHPILTV
jgi:diguanylate cyclase (GGDEF)-like protein